MIEITAIFGIFCLFHRFVLVRDWIFLKMDNQTRKDNQDQDQPESVLNIIRKEFFDLGRHDKDDDLKRSL